MQAVKKTVSILFLSLVFMLALSFSAPITAHADVGGWFVVNNVFYIILAENGENGGKVQFGAGSEYPVISTETTAFTIPVRWNTRA